MTQAILNPEWSQFLNPELEKDYYSQLTDFIKGERDNFEVYPKEDEVFAAFNFTNPKNLKVVILGQDPYHGPNQANGLCFSVCNSVKIPPSLKNIFQEIKDDLGCEIPSHGNLESWAKQGVLLLNATLTVRANSPGSHQKKGWEKFTDAVIQQLNKNKEGLVFILWGNYAKQKSEFINDSKHLVLQAAHPSPLARGAFFGNKHFSKTNYYLIQSGKTPINWCL